MHWCKRGDRGERVGGWVGRYLNRPSSRVTQSTDGVAFDLTGDFFQHGDFTYVRLAFLHPEENGFQPRWVGGWVGV